ncbi:hypothetical protein [Thalassotalea euphylliae]|uniref:Uncharacterized protein n=1 Tax=Thalassotalea euphylliae TaxID=1655234 RepID=A0A3E0U1X3_9GAMM|nr:hypothetical protein [Thalassotalea euphylliae]REL30719.1 hypothetical protein DXX94_08320 [Thalassotalea euphylliae]
MSIIRKLNLAGRKVGKVLHLVDASNYDKLRRLDALITKINAARTNNNRSFLKAIETITEKAGGLKEFKKQEMSKLDNFEWVFYLSDQQWDSFCFQWNETKSLLTANRKSPFKSEDELTQAYQTTQGPFNSKIQCFLALYKEEKVVSDYSKLDDCFKGVPVASPAQQALPKEDTKIANEKDIWLIFQSLKEDFREIGLVMKKQMLIFAKTHLEAIRGGANLEGFNNIDNVEALLPIADRARKQQIIIKRSGWLAPLKDIYNAYKVIGLMDKETRYRGAFDEGFSGKANRAKLVKYTQEMVTGIISAVTTTAMTVASFGATLILCILQWIKVFDILSSFATLIRSFIKAKQADPNVDLTKLDFRMLSQRTKTGAIAMNVISTSTGALSAGLHVGGAAETGAYVLAGAKATYKAGKGAWSSKSAIKNVKNFKDDQHNLSEQATEKDLLKAKKNLAKRLKNVEEIDFTFSNPLENHEELARKVEDSKSKLRRFMDSMVKWAKKAFSYLVKLLTKLIKFVLGVLIVFANIVGVLITGIVLLFKRFCELVGSNINKFMVKAKGDIQDGLRYLKRMLRQEIIDIDARLKTVAMSPAG